MESTFTKLRDDLGDDLKGQVSRLRKEVASLHKALARQGAGAYADTRETAADLYDDFAERLADAMPRLRRQSRAVRRTASDHPVTTALIGVALVGLVAAFLSRR
jgi:ElaB/YqjD/DUF883 family membrane-anchored ribosome-binding protein